jgi:hypothetical protein
MGNGAAKISSILVGGETIQYPAMASAAFIAAKLWILVLGAVVAIAFAVAVGMRLPAVGSVTRKLANIAVGTMLGGTIALAAFWSFVWQPALATHLSSRVMFDTYHDLAEPDEPLAIMGDLGDAPHDYAPDVRPEVITSRDQVVAALSRPKRVFAIVPISERCPLHRDLGKKPYFIVEDRNVKSLLYSNQVDGTSDKNPLRDKILHEEPSNIPTRPKGKIVFDNRIQLLGWDIPRSVSRGGRFEIKMFYKVLQPVGGAWTVLFHFDGGLRFNGDHLPIDNICPTSTWMKDDYIVDTYTVIAGGPTFVEGPYEVWTGFFTGTAPNWKNMPVSEAPGDMRDKDDRVKITTIVLD